MVFLLFVWPSETEAQKICFASEHYKTVVHSHPVSCAYTVMQNEITERRYERVCEKSRCVRFCEEETLYPGDTAIDLNNDPFIHQLLSERGGGKPSITLHVCKCASQKELRRAFSIKKHAYTIQQ